MAYPEREQKEKFTRIAMTISPPQTVVRPRTTTQANQKLEEHNAQLCEQQLGHTKAQY